MLTEEQIQEAEKILKHRHCAKFGHDFRVVVKGMYRHIPDSIICGNGCGGWWKVMAEFGPIDDPTVPINQIDVPTTVIPKVR